MEYKNLNDFLKRSGVLEEGNPHEIEEAKKAYRKIYMREYKRRKRKSSKEIVLSVSRKSYNRFRQLAKESDLGLSAFILGILEGKSFAPVHGINRGDLAGIALLLAKIHSELTRIADGQDAETERMGEMKEKIRFLETVFSKLFRGQTIDKELSVWGVESNPRPG